MPNKLRIILLKNQRKGGITIKTKLIILFLIIILSPNLVSAEETKNNISEETNISEELKEITTEVEIRYKWYKEIIEGDYYPLKEKNEDYIIDAEKMKFGTLTDWNEKYCNLSNQYYMKEYDFVNIYQKVDNARFVKLERFTYNDNVKIYYNNKEIDYKITYVDENTIHINLEKEYMVDNLTFYIPNASDYEISLYKDQYLSKAFLSKNIENEDLLIPDETWINSLTYYLKNYTIDTLRETGLTKKIGQTQTCRAQEIYVYKYKITKEYYDDNYHLNVDGYIRDINDYKIFYKEKVITNIVEKPITNIVEITKEKIVKEPKLEYIYIPIENEIKKIDSSEKIDCTPEIKTEIKTELKTIEKEILKVPKKIYVLIAMLLITISLLSIKLIKKYVV